MKYNARPTIIGEDHKIYLAGKFPSVAHMAAWFVERRMLDALTKLDERWAIGVADDAGTVYRDNSILEQGPTHTVIAIHLSWDSYKLRHSNPVVRYFGQAS